MIRAIIGELFGLVWLVGWITAFARNYRWHDRQGILPDDRISFYTSSALWCFLLWWWFLPIWWPLTRRD